MTQAMLVLLSIEPHTARWMIVAGIGYSCLYWAMVNNRGAEQPDCTLPQGHMCVRTFIWAFA